MNSGQIRLLDFSQTQAIVRETLPDGSTILKPDYLKIDKLSLELMGDLTALEENTTISLINSTLTSGLANNFGRLVKNLGLKLIHTADGQENVKTSVIYYKDDQVKKSYTLKRLVTTFQLKKVEKNDGMEEDLQFVLGEDLSRPY